MGGPESKEVARLREIALASLETANLEGTTAGYWLQSIIDKINLMIHVEDLVAIDLQDIATHQEEMAWQAFQFNAIATAILLFASGFLHRLYRLGRELAPKQL